MEVRTRGPAVLAERAAAHVLEYGPADAVELTAHLDRFYLERAMGYPFVYLPDYSASRRSFLAGISAVTGPEGAGPAACC
jgi:hypothetical protein